MHKIVKAVHNKTEMKICEEGVQLFYIYVINTDRSGADILSECTGYSCVPERRSMDDKKERLQEEYNDYVKQVTPTHNLPLNMLKAFITGGIICVLGQFILNVCKNYGLEQDMAGAWCSMILILLSILLTGFNIYPSIAKFGGAGALVPITGFANSVAAPAIEFKKEGQVFGIGCKIFTIAGPVILYGIFTSWVLGFLYWILKIWRVL